MYISVNTLPLMGWWITMLLLYLFDLHDRLFVEKKKTKYQEVKSIFYRIWIAIYFLALKLNIIQ